MINKMTYSSTAELVCEFTTDYSKLIDSLEKIKIGDAAHIEEGLNKASSLIIDETAAFTLVNVVLITDEFDNLRQAQSLRRLVTKLRGNRQLMRGVYLSLGVDVDEYLPMSSILGEEFIKSLGGYYSCQVPFSFPNRFDVICLCENDNSAINASSYRIEFDSDKFK